MTIEMRLTDQEAPIGDDRHLSDLIGRSQQGDMEAFGEIYEMFQSKISISL